MDNLNPENYRQFLEYFKAHVDPNDQLPVKVPGYNLTEEEIAGEVVNWAQCYLLQMKCPQVLLAPIINEVLLGTKQSYQKIPKQCGFDGYSYNPLKLSIIVVGHINSICDRLMDNAELNKILPDNSDSMFANVPYHSVKAIKNTRRKMEDKHICISDFNGMFSVKDLEPTSFYGVFDGHGGQDAAIYTSAHLCYNIANSCKYPQNIEAAMREAFLKTDDAFICKSEKHAMYSGTTALACIYRANEKRLIVGWVGDSQALLACEGKVCQIVAPHTPSIESERIRIENMGGVIMNWDGSYRVNGQLAISRAIGDALHKPFISSEPDISSVILDGGEDFLIIASDGLWEGLCEDSIAVLVYREIAKNPSCAATIADKVIESARNLTSDNITVIVVFFKDPYLIAKSTWLNKMETAYHNTENSVCEIEVETPMDHVKSSINSEIKPDQKTNDLLETKYQFDDDIGPETDVDAPDGSNVVNPPNMFPEDDTFKTDLPNGVKTFSLENKIIEHLSEQHKEFITDPNPFSDDQFDELLTVKDELKAETAKEKCEIVVDNKIIDALESLGITSEEKQPHDNEDESLDSGLVNHSSAEVAGYTEKVDNSHEKYYTQMQNEDPFDNNVSIILDKQTTEEPAYGEKLNCTATSTGEESEEEEDEWNYIKGDKQQDQREQRSTEKSEPKPTPSVVEPAEKKLEDSSDYLQKDLELALGSKFTAEEETEEQQQRLDEPLTELADSTPSDNIDAIIDESSETLFDNLERRKVEADADLCKNEKVLIDPVPATTFLFIPTEQEYKHQKQEKQQNQETQETEQHESVEYIPSPEPRTKLHQPEEIQLEPISQPNGLVSLEQEPSLDKGTTEELSKEILQEELRPNSLNFDMASKLNPDAKEFVPTNSPTLSNPTSPIMPEMPQNSFLLLGDDVVAQSPKKGIATMDIIDVPAEDDFQQEMNKCPHELEQFTEHTNGAANGDETIDSNSPISEPSYQELNLKEAMQCDEKLDNEYSDVLQNDEITNNHHPTEQNLLAREQNPMNMSFYEGRDETLIISNSDELNKVQPLPSDDESSELINCPSVEETMATNEKETHPLEEQAFIQHDENLFSLENPVESVNEEEHAVPFSESIFSAASQVVDDVTALVGCMQIEIPTAPQHEEPANSLGLNDQFSKLPEETEHFTNAIETGNLFSFEQDSGFENPVKKNFDEIAANLYVGQSALRQEVAEFSHPMINLSATETEEMVSPVVEVSQKEITTDNEFITDENVLDIVPPPVPVAVQKEEPIDEEICIVERSTVKQITEVTLIDTATEHAAAEPASSIANEVSIIEDIKPVNDEATVTTTSEKMVVSKPKTPGQLVCSAAMNAKVPATVCATKKASTAAKPSTTKPATKSSIAAKTKIVSVAKKTPVSTGPAMGAKVSAGGAKSPKVTATSRTSTDGMADKKPTATSDKKHVNGDAKTALVQKRTLTSTSASATAKTITTTAAQTSPGSAKSVSAAKLPATRPNAPAKATMSAKAPASESSRSTIGATKMASSTTTRTSTGLPTTKPRVAPITAIKPAGATTASKTTVSATKRISGVQTTTQKTAISSMVTTATATKFSSTSRSSVVSKATSTTSSAGLLRKTSPSGTAPVRKQNSSAKTGSKLVAPTANSKPAPIRKSASVKEAVIINIDTTQDLLDHDKQLKNDNNQLITSNGIETQMIVIDSAAD